MAFNDTLFQLGMDLTRSSTAQKEDHSFVASVAEPEIRDADQAHRDSVRHAGTSLFIDLHGAKRFDGALAVERALKRSVAGLGLKLQSVHFDRVAGKGKVAGVAVLSEGHLSFYGCTRTGFAAFDARGCPALKPEAALIALANAFEAREATIQKSRRSDATFKPALRIVAKVAGQTAKPKAQAKAA